MGLLDINLGDFGPWQAEVAEELDEMHRRCGHPDAGYLDDEMHSTYTRTVGTSLARIYVRQQGLGADVAIARHLALFAIQLARARAADRAADTSSLRPWMNGALREWTEILLDSEPAMA